MSCISNCCQIIASAARTQSSSKLSCLLWRKYKKLHRWWGNEIVRTGWNVSKQCIYSLRRPGGQLRCCWLDDIGTRSSSPRAVFSSELPDERPSSANLRPVEKMGSVKDGRDREARLDQSFEGKLAERCLVHSGTAWSAHGLFLGAYIRATMECGNPCQRPPLR